MSFSDIPFPGGPFVPHDVPCEYLRKYFSAHQLTSILVLNTTVEDVSKLPSPKGRERWKLTLRRHDPQSNVDEWWEEEFDAVIFGNGHYSIPYVSFSLEYCCTESSLSRFTYWIDTGSQRFKSI
jgi:cation diffusion facilitator CzcD-associated flavoprotein CzcO